MATLNTLRTRFGVVLSAVIAFALLAFIFSLKAEMGFMGSEPVVAKIDGHSVTYSEYQSEYNKIQRLSGADGSTEQQANMLFSQTWQALFSKFALVPSLNSMGIDVSEAERMSIIRGEIPTQTMYSAFSDPNTGQYSLQSINNFLLSAGGNSEADYMWQTLTDQACNERMTSKFAALVATGAYVNSLEVNQSVKLSNKQYDGRWVSRRYSDVADSLVSVSQAEIKSYYDQNIASYKREPSRTVSYVEFKVEPSAEDLKSLAAEAQSVAQEFANATDVRAFIRSNRSGSVADSFLSAAQLPASEVEALSAGKTFGPVEIDNTWRSARVLKSVVASDTLAIRHIVLSYTERELADSLLTALRKGGDFAQAAQTYSVYSETAQRGGDLGKMPFSSFTDEFVEKLAPAKKGDIVEIESGDMIQLMQVYDAGKRVNHYQVASVNAPILPSDVTRRTAHNNAGLFAVAAAKTNDDNTFKDAASAQSALSRTATIIAASRTLGSVAGSQEVARWAHRAEIGKVSEIFKVEGGYLVAMVTAVNDAEHRALSEVENTIKSKLMNNKKFEIIKESVSSASLDKQATEWGGTVATFEDVTFSSTYIRGLGVEPRVVGEIITTDKLGKLSQPIKGNSAAYLFEVTNIKNVAEPQSAKEEKVRAEATAARAAQQMLFVAVESLSEVEDNRGKAL